MIRTLEAVIDENGDVRLLEEIHLPTSRHALVTVLEDEPLGHLAETALLSEVALAEDWNRPEEEDTAWNHLQRLDSFSAVSVFGFVAIQIATGSGSRRLRSWRLVALPDYEQSLFGFPRYPTRRRGF